MEVGEREWLGKAEGGLSVEGGWGGVCAGQSGPELPTSGLLIFATWCGSVTN